MSATTEIHTAGDLGFLAEVIADALELGQDVQAVILNDDGDGTRVQRAVDRLHEDDDSVWLFPNRERRETLVRHRALCEIDFLAVDGQLVYAPEWWVD